MKNSAWRISTAVSVLLTLFVVGSSRAEDSFPPCWRGNPGTTYENWSFAVSNNPAIPEVFTNVNGTPQASFIVGAFGTGWKSVTVGGRTGAWDLGQAGSSSLAVPNFGGSPAWKYVQVQMTYFDAPGFYLPPVVSIAGATLVSSQVTNNQVAAPGNWKTYQTVWRLQPSPASETIALAGDAIKGLLIDQIIVDTRCPTAGDGDVPAYRPCWRGQPGTTFQQWLFGVSNNPVSIPAELVTNSFGTPHGVIIAGPSSLGYIQEDASLGCRQGVWDLGHAGTMTLAIPNTPSSSSGSYKYVRVQVTQYRNGLYNANAAVAISGGTLMSQQQQTIDTSPSGGQWVVAQSIWQLGPPCPASESVVLTGGANGSLIDQVVVDTLCLDFACPLDIVAVADAGQCSKSNVSWTLPAVNGCTVTNVTSTPANGSTIPVGTNSVNSVIQDGEGGTRTCTFKVIVADNEAPVARCQNVTVNLNGAGQATITGADVDNGSTDNCGIANRTVSPNSFTCANIGPNSVTLTVTDVNGNSATCNATVTVQDNLPPAIACPANITVNAAPGVCTSNVTFTVMATDNCGSASVVSVPASGFAFPVGATTVNSTADDGHGNTNQCSFTVTVVDSQPPVIACPANITVNAPAGGCTSSVTFTVTATDNCGSASVVSVPGSGFAFPVGTTTVNSTADDGHGNTNQCSFTVTVVDDQPPAITCPANITVNAADGGCTSNVTFAVTATDNCGSASVVSVPASGFAFPVGTTTVNSTADDGHGNTNHCSFTVTVVDNQPPAITCPANITVNTAAGGCTSNVTFAVTATDNCGSASVVSVPAGGFAFPIGATTVNSTADDGNGNTNQCSFTVTVVDHEPPTITCPVDLPDVHTDLGHCYATGVNLGTPTSSDNCGILTVTNNAPAQFPHGTTMVTWTAVDTSGNLSTCHQTVTVQDHEPPTIATCPPDRTVVGCQATMPDLTVEVLATDNCSSSFTVTQDPGAGASILMETTVVTITVRDEAGDSATCNATITLVPPTLSITGVGQSVTLTWPDGGTLLEAGELAGPWIPVPGAASPFEVPQPLADVKFYRLRCD